MGILNGQDFHLINYTSSDGLTQNSVHTSVVTSEGFIWLGTEDGINRFDGKNLKEIKPDYKKLKTKISKYISYLFCDVNNKLWVASATGIVIYDRVLNTFYDPSEIYKGFDIYDKVWVIKIQQDKNNDLWFQTNTRNLYKYEIKSNKTIEIVGNSSCNDIALTQESEIIVASGNAFYKMNEFYKIPILTLSKKHDILSFDVIGEEVWSVTSSRDVIIGNMNTGKTFAFKSLYKGDVMPEDSRLIYCASKDVVWIGSRSSGLCKVNIKEKTYKTLTPTGNKYSLATPFILSIYSKGSQTIIGQSGGGFAIVDDLISGISSYKSIDKIKYKIQDNMIFSLYKLNNQDMYSGTLYGGLLKTNLYTGEFQYFIPPITDKISPESKNIYTILKENGDLWMASWGGLLKFDLNSKKFAVFNDISDKGTVRLTSIIKLKNQNKLLIGGYNGGLRIFNITTKLFNSCPDPQNFQAQNEFRPRYMKEMNDGNVFISSEGNSFFKYNVYSGKFTNYLGIKNFSGTSRYFYFHKDKCFIATDNGLLMTDTSDFNILKVFATEHGMANNYIYSIQADNNGRLWIGNNGGITILNLENFTTINLTDKHGLQGLEFNTASTEKDSEGNLFFGGINGFSKINPSKVNFVSPDLPPIINEVRIMNQPITSEKDVSFLDTILTQYNKNLITIGFQTVNENLQRNATYRYKLTNVDGDWNLLSKRNYVNYSNLKPETHTFIVQSYNIDGTWSKPKILTIIVKPAWFQTWLFKIFALGLISLVIYAIATWRLNQIKQKATLEKDYLLKIKSLEMDNLRSQMNPHFMFNAMNSINQFIVEKNTKEASDYLTKFSRLMRMILEHSKKPTIPLSSEIEALQIYLFIETNRFENKFKYKIIVDEEIDQSSTQIPPLIIQPFLENSIWHGFLHHAQQGIIEIKINQEDENTIVIEILDNGVGRKKAAELKSKSSGNQKSFGMAITKERIINAHPENQVIIVDLYNEREEAEGTLVKIILKV